MVIFGLNSKVEKAHRIAWVIHYENIDETIKVLHKCDTPSCVNPEHLFLGSDSDNTKDKVFKGRQAKGSGISKVLTEEDILSIRELYSSRSKNSCELALLFNVNSSTIFSIVHGLRWRHVSGNIVDKKYNKGQWNGRAKLSQEDVNLIKSLSSEYTCRQLANKFNVHFSTIARAIKGKTWDYEDAV